MTKGNANFDTTLAVGDRVLFKESFTDGAFFGSVIERFETEDGVEYYVRPDDQERALDSAMSWEESGDVGEEDVVLMSVTSTDDEDAIVRFGAPLPVALATIAAPVEAPATPATPPNPKKLYGAQKPDLSLIPPVGDLHMAMAFENGAAKYGAYNWRDLPVEAMTYIAAAKRHLDLFLDGQDYSTDTNPPVHNLGHAMACCAIVLDSQELGTLLDNRPKPGASEAVANRMKAQKAAALAAKLGG